MFVKKNICRSVHGAHPTSTSRADYQSGLVAMELSNTSLGAPWIAQAFLALEALLPFRFRSGNRNPSGKYLPWAWAAWA